MHTGDWHMWCHMSSNTGLQPSPPLPSTLGLSLGLCPVAPHLPFLEWPLLSLGRLAERPQDRVLKTRSGRFQVLANYPDVQMRSHGCQELEPGSQSPTGGLSGPPQIIPTTLLVVIEK
jgi:hypothetical protein